MDTKLVADKSTLARLAAEDGAAAIRGAIAAKGEAVVVLATGASQIEILAILTVLPDIDWSRVTAFHLDEYLGLPVTHPASFRKYLRERFLAKVPGVKSFVEVVGDDMDATAELARLNGLLAGREVDLCFAGIGENCHLAFNDPPADFETQTPFIEVVLDEGCRRQQMGEGWFPTLADVPERAISMSIRQILKSRRLVVSVSDTRKARAVRDALEGPLTPERPASILREHPNCTIYLDPPAASLLAHPPA